MLQALLQRRESTDQGTAGMFYLDNVQMFTMELPERDNAPNISRIPEGSYKAEWDKSPKFGWCYHVRGVPNRGSILIHSGNLAGDVSLGYLSHSHGCILVANKLGTIDGQLAGLLSRPALQRLYSFTKNQPFQLIIRNA